MFRCLSFSAILALGVSGPAAASNFLDKYSQLLIFGDSISDQDNAFTATAGLFPQQPEYTLGRFTNAENYVDFIVAKEGLTESTPPDFDGTYRNYAFGGASADGAPGDLIVDLNEQVGLFNLEVNNGFDVGPRAAAVFFFGGNDAFRAAFEAVPILIGLGPDAAIADATARGIEVANVLKDQVTLFDGLVKDVFLVNLGNPALAPRFSQPDFLGVVSPDPLPTGNPYFPDFDPINAAPLPDPTNPLVIPVGFLTSAFAQGYNAQLEANAAMLRDAGFRTTLIDADTILTDFLIEFEASGGNTTAPCGQLGYLFEGLPFYDFSSSVCEETDPSSIANSAWFDGVHFTTTGHEVLAGAINSALRTAPIPLPAPVFLLGGGLVILGGLGWRRRG